jgi:glycosyltransferase involved in cell wall biosynthesis
VPDGVRFFALGGGKSLSVLRPFVQYLRRERPAVLMSSIFPANIAALIACAITHTPCVLREANHTADDLRARTLLGTLANRIAMLLLYRRATAVVALTPQLAAHLCQVARLPAQRITVIPNPAPAPVSPRYSGFSSEEPMILGCGRFVAQKDFSLLLAAFALIAHDRKANLVILGEGPLKQALRSQAEALGIGAKVVFPGHATDVGMWMRQARVFVLSSRWEGFPNVLLEALSAGCPVIATNCSDAVHDLLDNGRYGTIVPVQDRAAMAAGLAAVLDGDVSFDDPTEHLSRYQLEPIAMRYLEVLNRAAERSS